MTGATGFIGRRLCSLLTENGHGITAIVRPSSANAGNLSSACRAIRADLSDRKRLATACADASAVIYCAGEVRGGNPEAFKAANVAGVEQLVGVLNRAGRHKPFLLISSLAASHPELSDYANSKFLGERALADEAAFPWTIFRPPAVYGPGDREMLPILRLASRGLVARPGPRDQRLSLLHVDDLSRAVLAWLDNWQDCAGKTFTLDDGRPGGYGWEAIAQAAAGDRYLQLGIPRPLLKSVAAINLGLSNLFSYAPMLTPGKVRELTQDAWLCDNSELTRTTGWSPSIDLESGIKQLFSEP